MLLEHCKGRNYLDFYRLITNEILVSDLLTQVPEGKSSKEHTQDSTQTRLNFKLSTPTPK